MSTDRYKKMRFMCNNFYIHSQYFCIPHDSYDDPVKNQYILVKDKGVIKKFYYKRYQICRNSYHKLMYLASDDINLFDLNLRTIYRGVIPTRRIKSTPITVCSINKQYILGMLRGISKYVKVSTYYLIWLSRFTDFIFMKELYKMLFEMLYHKIL